MVPQSTINGFIHLIRLALGGSFGEALSDAIVDVFSDTRTGAVRGAGSEPAIETLIAALFIYEEPRSLSFGA